MYGLIKGTGKYDRFIHVLGNHDLYMLPMNEVSPIGGQKSNHSIDTPFARLIFLNTSRDTDMENFGEFVSEETIEWLGREFEFSEEKPAIVFAHHPVCDTTTLSNYHLLCIDEDIDMWKALNKKRGKSVFICGHTHRASIRNVGEWTFVQLDAFVDHPKVSIIYVDENSIEITSKELLDGKYDEHRKIIEETKRDLHH